MAANWQAIEDAIWQWVKNASGLADSQIVWSDQVTDINKPTGQHVRIRLGDDSPTGVAPEVTHAFDSEADPGEEITISAQQITELPVSVQVFGGASTSNSSARALANTIRNKLALPGTKELFDAVDISCHDLGEVRVLSGVLDADFESRAVFESLFYVLDSVSETNTYIGTVEIEDLDREYIFTVELDE